MVCRRPKELGAPCPGPGTAFQASAPAGSPARAGQALTVQSQEVPARVHARRAARREGHRGTHVSGDSTGGLGSKRSAVEGPECIAVGGGRGWSRDTPRPRRPAPPPPEPANPRLSPPLVGMREGGQSWGPGRLANPGPGQRVRPDQK